MNFSIDTYEYEETPETQIAGVRSKVEGGVQRLDYLENVYKQKQIGVMNRIRNLRWTVYICYDTKFRLRICICFYIYRSLLSGICVISGRNITGILVLLYTRDESFGSGATDL